MLNIQQTLESLHTDGVNLTIKELLDYQRKTHLLSLAPRKHIQSKLAGSYLAKTKGRGMEFDEARHYQPGDDIRAIDWRVTARTGKTHTKLYREEKERPVFVLADMSNTMHFGTQLLYKSVQAAHLAALIAWSAKGRGDKIGGLIFNQHSHRQLKPFTRQKAVLGFIHGLLSVHQPNDLARGEYSFADACGHLRRLVHPGSLVFVISDFSGLDEKAKQHLSRIAKHSEVVGYGVSDPFEHELPKVKGQHKLSLTDGLTSQNIVLGAKETSQQYQSLHSQLLSTIQQRLTVANVQFIPISTAMPLEQQLSKRARR